jgi:hypothetical protein
MWQQSDKAVCSTMQLPKTDLKADFVAQAVEHWPTKTEFLSSNLSTFNINKQTNK